MLVLIQQDNNKVKDYVEFTTAVYDIPVADAKEVKKLYYAFILRLMKQHKYTANPAFPLDVLLPFSSNERKENHKRLLAENDLFTWIERNWNVEKIPFSSVNF